MRIGVLLLAVAPAFGAQQSVQATTPTSQLTTFCAAAGVQCALVAACPGACGHELDTWAYPGYTLGAIQNFLLPVGKGVGGGGIGSGGVR